MHSSLVLLPALAAAVYAQGSALPGTALPAVSTTTTSIAQGNCNACFIVADVAQVIFADFTQTATASAVVSAGTGRNGTVITSTFIQPAQQFSFGSSGLLGGSTVGATYVPIDGTTLVLNGATLTSPTAYNVFTGYTSFTQTIIGGSCTTQAGAVSSLPTAFKFTISPGAPASEIFDAEKAFIANIGGPATCLAGGVVVSSTVPLSVTTTTVTSSTTGLFRPSSLPVSSAAAETTGASTTTASTAAATNATNSGTSTSIVILTPTPTIVLGAGSTFHPRAFSASLVAALLVIPGIAAWML